uniref:Cytoplasmic chaperone TorD n=1 Tax=Chlorobium chlorochromatii (strain CaD3) TaxID=340177 RepID=Q3AS11_CHLCH
MPQSQQLTNEQQAALQQALIYRFLGLVFAYPNDAFLPTLQNALQKISDNAARFQPLLDAFAAEPQEQLQAEYTRLFLNGYPNTPCPPYESVYREERMMGESSLAVQKLYQQWEIAIDANLSDHLATELEFLAFLSAATTLTEVATDALATREYFLEEHVRQWLPQFCRDLQKEATVEAYRLLSQLLANVLLH